jgi:trehalose 6-phosphate phosphatase
MDGYGDFSLIGEDWAFFLDVDGTLIDIAPTPASAKATPETIGLLERLNLRFGGAVALVSGRPIAGIDQIFDPLKLPAAGLHGIERRNSVGKFIRSAVRHQAIDEARAALTGIEHGLPGVLIEDKGDTIAIHYRLAPQYEEAVMTEARKIVLRAEGGLELLPGKMLAELRPPGPNKGNAVADFMAEAPFEGRKPVFIGDDTTDEDGFSAVNNLGGYSIRIGHERVGSAKHLMRDAQHLHTFLTMLVTRPTHVRT